MKTLLTIIRTRPEAIALAAVDAAATLASGITARDALLTDPLAVELEKLGVRHADMARVVQRAARLEAQGITDDDVDRIVWQWYRECAEAERLTEGAAHE